MQHAAHPPVFVNTRPAERAGSLTYLIGQAGYPVISCPFLELVSLVLSPQEQQCLSHISTYQQVIVTSPAAARLGLKQLAQPVGQLTHIHWVAVGQATARVLEKQGIQAHTPVEENSEGLLAILHCLPGLRSQIWAGLGGRTLIQDTLTATGLPYDRISLYQRQQPAGLAAQWLQQQPASPAVPLLVLLSSEAAWHSWQLLARLQQNPVMLLVLGKRVFELVRQQTENACQLASLEPDHILQTIREITCHE